MLTPQHYNYGQQQKPYNDEQDHGYQQIDTCDRSISRQPNMSQKPFSSRAKIMSFQSNYSSISIRGENKYGTPNNDPDSENLTNYPGRNPEKDKINNHC